MKDSKQKFQYGLVTKLIIVILSTIIKQSQSLILQKDAEIYPCNEDRNITIFYLLTPPPPNKNFVYLLLINRDFIENSKIHVKFDTEASVSLISYSTATITSPANSTFVDIIERRQRGTLGLSIKGTKLGTVPHIQSIVIDNVEVCKDPQMGVLDEYIVGQQYLNCGRRKVSHVELIVTGQPSKPGDWPWHAALYTLNRYSTNYICGGTLLSEKVVLTAAHCVTIRGVPRNSSSLSVILGKYNLMGGDPDTQEREVQEIKVHEQYEHRLLNNDIALLKLKSEVVFTDYVQPACLWRNNIPNPDNFGTIVGWGFNQIKQLSPTLHQVKLPKVSEITCIRSNPLFFSRILNDEKFCAGYRNGTSVCNGDSGGGFMVFVPDAVDDVPAKATGSWHINGIVSTSVSKTNEPICDPNHYAVFTDVTKHLGWILRNIN